MINPVTKLKNCSEKHPIATHVTARIAINTAVYVGTYLAVVAALNVVTKEAPAED